MDEHIINLPFSNSLNSIDIVPLYLLTDKKIIDIAFEEIIGLIFHANFNLACDRTYKKYAYWDFLYKNFVKDIEKQNLAGWPIMTVNKNDYFNRIDIISIEKPFIDTDNILTLLHRLLYIENYKINAGYDNPVLKFKFIKLSCLEDSNIVENVSLYDLFSLLEKYLAYYVSKYGNVGNIENSLGSRILGLIR